MADSLFNPSRLYEVLAAQGLLPQVANKPYTGEGAAGRYSSNPNRITADPAALPHEMVHATQFNLLRPSAEAIAERKKKREDITPEEERFLEAMQKTYGETFGMSKRKSKPNIDIAKKVKEQQLQGMYYPNSPDIKDPELKKLLERYDQYRTRREELEAFGVEGTLANPLDRSMQGTHLNPSMATEFDILLSLYNSLPSSVKKQTASKRQQEIEQSRSDRSNENTQRGSFTFNELRSDPFAPTIK